MLSDEEKKNLLKKLQYCELEYQQDGYLSVGKFEAIKQAIEIIEKQSKEIEELKEQCKEVVCVPEGTCFMIESKDVDKKWEDKIKAKIEELEKQDRENRMSHNYLVIPVLQSLLEKE